jgi:hypothetical protein
VITFIVIMVALVALDVAITVALVRDAYHRGHLAGYYDGCKHGHEDAQHNYGTSGLLSYEQRAALTEAAQIIERQRAKWTLRDQAMAERFPIQEGY